jgi:hypothetical protein
LLRIGVSKERNLCDVHAICNLVFLFFWFKKYAHVYI